MLRLFTLGFAMVLAVGGARADDGMRCDRGLVTAGMDTAAVAERCGPPTRSDRKEVCSRSRYGRAKLTIDTWVYDRGAQEFTRTLTFHDGTLQSVEVGEYGR